MQAAGFKLGRAVSARTGESSGPLRCFPGGLAVCLSILVVVVVVVLYSTTTTTTTLPLPLPLLALL